MHTLSAGSTVGGRHDKYCVLHNVCALRIPVIFIEIMFSWGYRSSNYVTNKLTDWMSHHEAPFFRSEQILQLIHKFVTLTPHF
jgi:hypothetical protein